MAEFGGPADSEEDKSSVYGDYRFDPQSPDNQANDGFELPPWTDPPTGEIPRVLSDLDTDDFSMKSRLSSLGVTSFFNSPIEERAATDRASAGASKDAGEGPSDTRRPRRRSREGRMYRRSESPEPDEQRSESSSRSTFSRTRNPEAERRSHDLPEDVFRPPEDIVLPAKRFNVSMPKLSGGRRRKPAHNRRAEQKQLQEDLPTAEAENVEASDEGEFQDEFAPSSFASRRDRISRSKEEAPPDHSRSRSPLYVRVATGVGLGVVVLLAFHFGALPALAVVAVAIVLAVVEFYDTLRRAGFRPAALLGIAGTLSLLITTYQKGANGIALVFASMIVASMLWYLVGVIRGQPTLNISVTFLGFIWIGGLGSFAAAMLRPQDFPHSHGVAYLLGAVIATVADDTAAYFLGSWVGRHKLAPDISPTKSWEGLIAGALASLIVSAVVVSHIKPWTVSSAVILGIVVAIVAPLGDLSESMIKRDLHIKDMGKLLPGHGGMLDRIDGLLFVLPTVYYLLKILHLS